MLFGYFGAEKSGDGKRRVVALAMLLCLVTAPQTAGSQPRASDPAASAIVAGGCFWCVEADFDRVPGVLETVSGYTGGHVPNPTYEQVGGKTTGHREAVRIRFDPAVISYEQLMVAFWRSIDPTDDGGQFCDRGEPYESAVFVSGPEQRRIAEETKAQAEDDLGQPIVTPIEDAGIFYPAEGYHQDYYEKNALTYKFYRWRCGRDERVRSVWGDAAYTGIPDH